MKRFLLAALLLAAFSAYSQNNVFYVAAKTGLSIREKPAADAKVLDKIPLGTKITLIDDINAERVTIVTEGMEGYWAKVKYNNKTGYIVSTYLFPWAPPKTAVVKEMKDYFKQITLPAGSLLKIKSGERRFDGSGWEIHKQLYKNGAEWHHHIGWEDFADAYFLPGFGVEQGFLLLRMIPEFKQVFGEKEEFPTENCTYQKDGREYNVTVTRGWMGDYNWIDKIRIEYEDGAMYFLEMYMLYNQLVILYGAGV